MVEIFGKEVLKDSATLATQSYLAVDTTIKALQRPFLLTKVKLSGHLQYFANLTDKVLMVLAYGSPSDAELELALNSTVINPETNQDNYRLNQVEERRVIDFIACPINDIVSTEKAFNWQPHIPKGGLPSGTGGGFQIGFYNASTVAALADGPIFRGLVRWMGAWLS